MAPKALDPPDVAYVVLTDSAALDSAWQAWHAGRAMCSFDGAPIALCVPNASLVGREGPYRLACPQCLRTSPWFDIVDGIVVERSPETLPAPSSQVE